MVEAEAFGVVSWYVGAVAGDEPGAVGESSGEVGEWAGGQQEVAVDDVGWFFSEESAYGGACSEEVGG